MIRDTFFLTFQGPSFTVLPQALRFWVGIFNPQAFFTLHSFPTFLTQRTFIKASVGASKSFLKFAELHADPQNSDPAHMFVWFTAIHNLVNRKNLFFNRTKYYHELLVVKSIVHLLLIRFELFSLVKSICKGIKNTLNKACTAYNPFDETTYQGYFEKATTRKAAKHHIK